MLFRRRKDQLPAAEGHWRIEHRDVICPMCGKYNEPKSARVLHHSPLRIIWLCSGCGFRFWTTIYAHAEAAKAKEAK